MKKLSLAAFLLFASAPSYAALYTIAWDNTEFFPTDTATFTTAITPYLAVYGQNLYHVHQQLAIGPGAAGNAAHSIFIPINWSNWLWLELNGTNTLSYSGWDPRGVAHTITARPVGPVPEPSTVGLVLAGILGLLGVRRR